MNLLLGRKAEEIAAVSETFRAKVREKYEENIAFIRFCFNVNNAE